MAEKKPPLSHDFGDAANRRMHDQLQIFYSLPLKARQQILDRIDQADKARAKKEREQKARYRTDIEEARRRQLLRHKTPEYVPPWAQRKLTPAALDIRAKNDVKARSRAELHAIERKLEEDIGRILAAHGALEKKKQLDKERDAVKKLAAQRRQAREATRVTQSPLKDRRPAPDRNKSIQPRSPTPDRAGKSPTSWTREDLINRSIDRFAKKERGNPGRERGGGGRGRGRER